MYSASAFRLLFFLKTELVLIHSCTNPNQETCKHADRGLKKVVLLQSYSCVYCSTFTFLLFICILGLRKKKHDRIIWDKPELTPSSW